MREPAKATDVREVVPAGWAECAAACAGFASIIAYQFVLVSHLLGQSFSHPWTKPFWLDEFHTLELAREPSLIEQMSKLAHGADFNPPALYILLYIWKFVAGSPNEWNLRLFSFSVTLVALAGIYRLLRQSFGRLVAFAITIGIWCGNPILIEQAFEARFYALWLASCVWLCNSLVALERRPDWWPAWVFVALFSALVCTVHYFGIFTLCLIALFHVACYYRGVVGAGARALILGVGPVALACCVPLYLGQRTVLGWQTWVPPPSFGDVGSFSRGTSTWLLLTLFGALYFFDSLLPVGPDREKMRPVDTKPLSGVFSLLLLPFVMILFSFLVQPAMIARYAFPTVASVAPVMALLAVRVRPWLLASSLPLVVLYGAANTASSAFGVRQEESVIPLTNRSATEVPGSVPIVIRNRDEGYIASRYGSVTPGRIRISFPEGADGGVLTNFDQVEAKVTDRMAELYPDLPARISMEEMRRAGRVIFIASSPVDTLRQQYPGFTFQKLDAQGRYTAYLLVATGDDDREN